MLQHGTTMGPLLGQDHATAQEPGRSMAVLRGRTSQTCVYSTHWAARTAPIPASHQPHLQGIISLCPINLRAKSSTITGSSWGVRWCFPSVLHKKLPMTLWKSDSAEKSDFNDSAQTEERMYNLFCYLMALAVPALPWQCKPGLPCLLKCPFSMRLVNSIGNPVFTSMPWLQAAHDEGYYIFYIIKMFNNCGEKIFMRMEIGRLRNEFKNRWSSFSYQHLKGQGLVLQTEILIWSRILPKPQLYSTIDSKCRYKPKVIDGQQFSNCPTNSFPCHWH